MAGESVVQVTEGVGKKLHTWQRAVGANNVEDEYVIPGEYPLPSYVVWGNASIATANDHILELMAGATLNLRIRRIRIEGSATAGAATLGSFDIVRLTAAGTGGGVVTPSRFDTTDAAAGATGMTLPGVKGTESTVMLTTKMQIRSAISTSAGSEDSYEWTQLPGHKPIIIPAGAANGICIKSSTAIAGASIIVTIEFVESSFL